MALRERLHDGLDMLSVFSPLSSTVLSALPAAVAAQVRSERGRELRRSRPRRPSGGAWGHPSSGLLDDAIEQIVVVLPPGLDAASLAIAAFDTGYRTLPISIVLSGDTAAFMFPHALFDGVGCWAQTADIFARATATPLAARAIETASFPLLGALSRAKLLSYRALSPVRLARRAAEREPVLPMRHHRPIAPAEHHRRQSAGAFRLEPQELERIDATASTGEVIGRRSTRGMKLAEIALAAAADTMDPAFDYRVRMMIDLRRYTARDRDIRGPFSNAYPIGSLRRSDNTAGALTVRLREIISSKVALVALAGNLSGLVKSKLRHPFSKRARSEPAVEVNISVLPTRVADEAWGHGDRYCLAMSRHPSEQSNPYIQIAQIDDAVVISVWTEGDLLDPDAFEQHFFDHAQRRVATTRSTVERLQGASR